jgi:hypothetical protein
MKTLSEEEKLNATFSVFVILKMCFMCEDQKRESKHLLEVSFFLSVGKGRISKTVKIAMT